MNTATARPSDGGGWLVAAILAGALALITGSWWVLHIELEHDRHSVSASAEKDATNLARAFEEHVARTVKDVDFLLRLLRDRWQDSPATFIPKARQLQGQYGELVVQIGIIAADGTLLISNLERVGTPVDLSDREHYRVHRDTAEDRLFISKPVQGRVSGKWSIQFARRLANADGSFAGVVVLSIDPTYFERFYDTVDVGQRGAVVLIGLDRVFRARASRVSTAQSPLGQEVLADRPFLNPARPEAGVYRVASSVDGVRRINAYRRLRDYPLAVLVALAEDEVFAEHMERRRVLTGWTAAFSALVLAGGLALAWLLWMRQRDRARLERLNEELRHIATVDPLTGAWNRRHFLELANRELERARRHHRPLCVLMLDVDHFKRINDTYGHAIGDAALVALVAACRGALRGSDLLGRLGGEEFAVLLPETDAKNACEVAERLRYAISAIALPLPAGLVGMTASIGVAAADPADASMERPLIRADEALYRAKAEGRNRVARAADPAMAAAG
ncbi:MAG TPA: sensor domain-containing diguanylate cyclase [Azospirillum sp.]|nr:sensor domain-containing diguanylate cyclase [Azospirillum sp.]